MAYYPNWLDLPLEILQIICEKLCLVEDYARFGIVCSHFRAVLKLCRNKIPPQLPVVMTPKFPCLQVTGHVNNRSLANRWSCDKNSNNNNGQYEVRDQEVHCCGSNHGWLVTRPHAFSNDKLICDNIRLFNPFLPVDNVIPLPSLKKRACIDKAVLSDNPSNTSSYLVMIVYGMNLYSKRKKLAFFRSGETSWTYFNDSCKIVEAIAYWKDRLYAICSSRTVLRSSCLSIPNDEPKLTRVATFPSKKKSSMNSHCTYHIVESPVEEQLLFVERRFAFYYDGICSRTLGFRIFKYEERWIQLKALRGGQSLFLGDRFSSSVLASHSDHCKPNHIYFVFPKFRIKRVDNVYAYRNELDAGVFSLEDGSLEELCIPEQHEINPIWIQPTLNMNKPATSTAPILFTRNFHVRNKDTLKRKHTSIEDAHSALRQKAS